MTVLIDKMPEISHCRIIDNHIFFLQNALRKIVYYSVLLTNKSNHVFVKTARKYITVS